MFEDSLLVEDRNIVARRRRIAVASVGLQGFAMAAFIAIPLIWPETLPLVSVAPKMTSLSVRKPPPKIEPRPIRVVTTNDAVMRAPSQPAPVVEHTSGSMIVRGSAIANAAEEPMLALGGGMSTKFSLNIGPGSGTGPAPVVVAAAPNKTGPPNVSSGVMAGRLLAPIQPVYPTLARATHTEGTVIVTATIDKTGRIVGLQVLSGPMMLRQAAADAISEARYKPYQLNGQPTDVTTTITVTFHMGS